MSVKVSEDTAHRTGNCVSETQNTGKVVHVKEKGKSPSSKLDKLAVTITSSSGQLELFTRLDVILVAHMPTYQPPCQVNSTNVCV